MKTRLARKSVTIDETLREMVTRRSECLPDDPLCSRPTDREFTVTSHGPHCKYIFANFVVLPIGNGYWSSECWIPKISKKITPLLHYPSPYMQCFFTHSTI